MSSRFDPINTHHIYLCLIKAAIIKSQLSEIGFSMKTRMKLIGNTAQSAGAMELTYVIRDCDYCEVDVAAHITCIYKGESELFPNSGS